MEFILIFAFSLVIIIPIIALVHSQYSESKENLDESQAKEILDKLSTSIQTAYYSGYPTRMTLEIYFPSGIETIWVNSSRYPDGIIRSELVFRVTKGSNLNELVAVFPFNVTSSLSKNDGKRKVLIKAEEDQKGNPYVTITDTR